jgi:hypothetical protein
MRVEVKRPGQKRGVLEDLRGAGVPFRRHESGLLEERKVRVRLHIAHAARVPIPVPGATEVTCLLDDPEVGDPVLAEVDGREHSSKTATHDYDGGLLDQRIPGEAWRDKRVPVEVLEFALQFTPLGHPLRAQSLLLLLAVPLTQLVDRGTLCAVVLLHCCRPSSVDRS